MRPQPKKFTNLWTGVVASFLFVGTVALAQDPEVEFDPPEMTDSANPGKPDDLDDESIIRKPKDTTEAVVKEFTNAERAKACAKFNGKIVSLSGEMWKVIQCKRHQIHDSDTVFQMSRRGTSIVEADSRDLAAIPIGPTWETLQNAKQRPCSAFNGRYVTFSFTDIYFVERCLKRLVPDYETLIQHRKEKGIRSHEIVELTDTEFYGMKAGRDISSVVDKEFSKLLDGSAGVDIIPIDEACKGVEGKFVSFYSRLYKIEKCRKREIDAESFTMKSRGRDLKLVELKAEQWLSMPDGKPWNQK